MADESSSTREKLPFSEYTMAFLSLRLWIGLRMLFAGLDKFKGSDGYSMEYYKVKMDAIATTVTENSFLPAWSTKLYAMPLGFILVGVGVMVLVGFLNRLALFLAALTFVSLAFGLMVLPDDQESLFLGLHVAITAGALCLVRHNRLSITRW